MVFTLNKNTYYDLHRDIKEPDLKAAMNGHILGFGKLVGLYKRK